jgi:hypothetical protein
MMNFYYDPILGLQYTTLEELFLTDLLCLPQDIKFDTELWLKYIREMGIQILNYEKTK